MDPPKKRAQAAGEVIWDVKLVDKTPGMTIHLEITWIPDRGGAVEESLLRVQSITQHTGRHFVVDKGYVRVILDNTDVLPVLFAKNVSYYVGHISY